MDPHRNIFYYYSGKKSESEEFHYDRQLENNTTKALVNLLELSPDRTPLETFLRKTGIGKDLQIREKHLKDFRFSLQRIPDAARLATRRCVLKIYSEEDVGKREGGRAGGRPDAWIYSPSTSTAIMIESKLGREPSQEQIRGHLDKVGWSRSTSCFGTTWQYLYSLHRLEDDFLSNQFVSYLEAIGMARFEGFSSEDFDFFLHRDEEYKKILKKKLKDLGSEVHCRLPAVVRGKFVKPRVGNVGRSNKDVWLAFERDKKKKPSFANCNPTIAISADYFSVNVVIRGGRYTDTGKAIAAFHKRTSGSPEDFEQYLGYLPETFCVNLYARRGRKGGPPTQGNEVWEFMDKSSLRKAKRNLVNCIRTQIESIDFPRIRFADEIPRGDEILSDKNRLVERCCKSIVQLARIYDFLES
ncbi:MAG: hypothetical protein ABIH04_09315 [Planctomycetota bacterium]